MKRFFIILCLIMSLVLILPSCSKPNPKRTSSVATDRNDSLAKIDMATVKNDINYKRLPDINSKNIQEIKLKRKVSADNLKICQIADGFISGSMSSKANLNSNNPTIIWPVVTKLDNEGNVLWEKSYQTKGCTGEISSIKGYSDGSFVFSVQTMPYQGKDGTRFEKSYIIKCDKDGNQLWKHEFDDYNGSILEYMFLTDNGDIIIVGEWPYVGGKQVQSGSTDIVITKLDKDGRIKGQKSFGGSNFDEFTDAQFDNKIGLVLCGYTQSSDGDFALSKDGYGDRFVVCFDENLNLRWRYIGLKGEILGNTPFVISKGCVYVTGFIQNTGEKSNTYFLIKFDNKGSKIWTKTNLAKSLHCGSIAALSNGSIAISFGSTNEGELLIIDKDGKEKKSIDNVGFSADNIITTEDGGFIATSIRLIKTIPQPAYISAIWYDSEVVAVKFNKKYSMEWRKTYDNYKNVLTHDFVQPLGNGKLIVEGKF